MTIDLEVLPIAVILVPLSVLWALALLHIMTRRPDLSTSWKGIWSATVIMLPFVGVMIYSMLRPPRPPKRNGPDDPSAVARALEDARELAAAHERGAISDESFAAGKAQLFGVTKPVV